MRDSPLYDAIIVGGGPAGLSAALVLGRCRRRVLLCDVGKPRNAASRGLHGFLTRDGVLPEELLRVGRQQLEPYGVEIASREVARVKVGPRGFTLTLDDGRRLRCRKLLLATGVMDRVPDIPGAAAMYGRSVFHCPYCDGWEMRDQPVAVYGRRVDAADLALGLMNWTRDVVLLTDGPARMNRRWRDRLARNRVAVREERVERLEGRDGVLERVVFARGEPLPRRGLFFRTAQYQRSPLAEALGCEFNHKGTVRTDRLSATCVPGLYCAGDASEDVQLVIVAAAEGAKAAFAIDQALQKEALR
ncbi:MAG: NAD(P)/FAD-dependent oxidoreductase [Thermoanaerobaculia bacterium]